MIRRRLILLFLPTALLLLLAGAMAWLLHTESGAGWAWQQASKMVPGELLAGSVDGTLRSGLVLNDFSFGNESVSIQSARIGAELKFDLFPPAISVQRLNIGELQVQLLDTGEQEPESNLAETIEGLQLPMPLRLSQVSVGRLTVLNASGEEQFRALDIRLDARWQEHISLSQASLQAFDTDWMIEGELGLQAPFDLDASVSSRTLAKTAEDRSMILQGQSRFKGTLQRLDTQLSFQQPDIQVDGELLDLLSTPNFRLQLQANTLNWPLDADPESSDPTLLPVVSLAELSLKIEGAIEQFLIKLDSDISGEQIPNSRVNLAGTGNLEGVSIEELQLSGPEAALTATAELSWEEDFAWSASTDISRLDPRRWLEDWPEAHPVNGKVNLAMSADRLEFSELQLNIHDLETVASGFGEYQLSQGVIAGELSWQTLAWPLGAGESSWSSEYGQLKISGHPDEWTADGELALLVSGFPEGILRLTGGGNSESLQLAIERGEILGGHFSGQANFSWLAPSTWSADINAEDIDITPLLPDYPGIVSGKILASGEVENERMQFDIKQLNGQVRGLELSAQGKLALRGLELSAENLRVRSGDAQLTLDGNPSKPEGLAFSARINALQDLLADASGSLHADGAISLDPAAPRLDLDVSADDLVLGDTHIASIRTQSFDRNNIILEIDQAETGDTLIEDLVLELSGSQPLERIQLKARLSNTLYEASLNGQVVDWSGLLESGWQGSISEFRVSKENLGQLELEQAVNVQFSTEKLFVDKGCLRGPKNGTLCFGGSWSDQGAAEFEAEIQDISLDTILLFVDMDWAFTHSLRGNFNWVQLPGKRASAEAQFALSPGELLFEDAGTDFETGPGVFQFRISEGDLHSGKLEIPIPGTGGIDVDFSIPHIADGTAAAIIAHVVLDLKDISALGLFVPHIDAIAGELNADIKVGGTVSDPQLTGHATLVRGQLEEYATGLHIRDITLAGSVYQYDHTVMNGTFKAGDGRGRIKADVRFVDFLHPEIKLELNGDGLLLVNVPDLHLVANPDIEVEWTKGLLKLGGNIMVPAAQLSPRYLPSSSAVESPDLVIISEQIELVPQANPQEAPVRIEGEIEIELGNEVSLKLDRATANVKGKTRFIWDGDMIPMGDGAFDVTGKIYAYGQLLTISEGRVSFPRISAGNPYLNIKAEREIYGNNQVKTAGVLISGTLKKPTMDTYTYPPTTKERALTLLITGNDFDYEQGVGAVEVGMYVAPRLYISYGIGLFEDQNVISARYDLKSGFGIKATSGQRETGVDISYTIER